MSTAGPWRISIQVSVPCYGANDFANMKTMMKRKLC